MKVPVIASAVGGLPEEMAERGHARVQAEFTFERMIERTAAVYRQLVPGR